MHKKEKIEWIILGSLALLLTLFLVFRGNDKIHYKLPRLHELDKTALSRIEVEGPQGKLSLSLKEGEWILEDSNRPADPALAEKMVSLLDGSQPVDLVSQRGAVSSYGLDEKERLVIKAWQGDGLIRNLYVGNVTQSGGYSYFALPETTGIYTLRGDWKTAFGKTSLEFRDKRVMVYDSDSVTKISFLGDDKEITLNREENLDGPVWKSADGKEWDQTKISNVVIRFNGLKCLGYETVPPAGSPLYTLTLTGKETQTLTLYKANEENRYIGIASRSEDPFLIDGGAVKWMFKLFDNEK